MPADLAKTATALKANHPDLLRGEPSFHEPELERRMDALDAARARLRGGEKVAKDQMALDLSAP